jgi:Domain of unknown function (DUF4864)
MRLVRALAALLIAGVVCLACVAGRAQDGASIAPDDRGAIQRVISDQIAAFLADDGARAYGFAAPGIQRLFPSSDMFMAMVRGGYAPVYRPREFRFGRIERADELVVQFVHIVGPDGRPALAAYFMERQADGSWRIAGCQLHAPPGEAA